MAKNDITIDIVNLDKVVKILRHAYESAEIFLFRVDNGSISGKTDVTYKNMKDLIVGIDSLGIPAEQLICEKCKGIVEEVFFEEVRQSMPFMYN